jgi:hypothetical protein
MIIRNQAVLDTHALDAIVSEPRLFRDVSAAVEAEHLRLLWTEVTFSEIAALPDLRHRTNLYNFVCSHATLVSPRPPEASEDEDDLAEGISLDAAGYGPPRDPRGAVIVAAAALVRGVVCTRDRKLALRARLSQVQAVRPENLVQWASPVAVPAADADVRAFFGGRR